MVKLMERAERGYGNERANAYGLLQRGMLRFGTSYGAVDGYRKTDSVTWPALVRVTRTKRITKPTQWSKDLTEKVTQCMGCAMGCNKASGPKCPRCSTRHSTGP